ncbi:MAG: type II toxin-antitoxin system VapC family toxin [Acidobacteriota bacterium]|nr:type II toxin-antitoxin system VapC family toxin [Acidobacteriota bacterium]
MAEAILDSSVILAILKGEALQVSVLDIVEGAVMSAVNLTEVLTRLSDLGMTASPKSDLLLGLLDRIEPFLEKQARTSAALRRETSHVGLSLGDRACLALALELGGEVYTTDRLWSGLRIGCPIHLLR